MKKGITILLILAMASVTHAQQLIQNNTSSKGVDLKEESSDRPSSRRDFNSEWYLPYAAFGESLAGVNYDRFVRFIMPDSNGVTITEDNGAEGIFNVGIHSVGETIDPKGGIFDFADPNVNRLSRFNTYTIDSLFFVYGYVRNIDSIVIDNEKKKVVDTLIIQLYQPTALEFGGLGGSDEIWAAPAAMDHTTGLGLNAAETIKIALDETDSTLVGDNGWATKSMIIPTSTQITSNDVDVRSTVCAYTVTYKPMKGVNLGDTLFDQYNNAFPNIHNNITNKNNYFMMTYFVNSGARILQEEYYNNHILAPSWLRYGQTPASGWTDYAPGNALQNIEYGMGGFRLTTQTLDVINVDQSGYGLADAYPNPASSDELVTIDFELGAGSDAVISISDIAGKTILVRSDHFAQGLNTFSFNSSELNSGIYIYSIEAGNFKATKKLIIE
jgi:hypothetical protein